MIVETVLSKMDKTVIVSASGLAGYGRSNDIKTNEHPRVSFWWATTTAASIRSAFLPPRESG